MKNWAACRPKCSCRCMTNWCLRCHRGETTRCARGRNRRWRASNGWTFRWWWMWEWETTGAMRNRILTSLLWAMTIAAMTLTAQKRTVTDAEVKRVHASALLIDTHNDFPTEQAGQDRPFTGAVIDIGAPAPMAHTDLARLKAGGVGAVFFAAYVGANFG